MEKNNSGGLTSSWPFSREIMGRKYHFDNFLAPLPWERGWGEAEEISKSWPESWKKKNDEKKEQ